MVHKVSTHCVACLASSVGGGGQVREGGWLTRVRQLAGIWYPGSQALGLVALSLGPGGGGGGQGGTRSPSILQIGSCHTSPCGAEEQEMGAGMCGFSEPWTTGMC